MNKIYILMLLLFSSCAAAYDGWSDFRQVTQYRVRSNGYVIVRMDTTNHINPSKCSDTTWLALKINDDKSTDYIFSSIISSHAAGNKIKFELQGCSNGGTQGNPNIVGVLVE